MKYDDPEVTRYLAEAYSPTWRFAYSCKYPQFTPHDGVFRSCRKCWVCLEYKRKEWTARSVEERSKWPRAWFLTLTYADTRDYSYENVKKYFKRLRKRYPRRISYICTDEFDSSGTRDRNPHHHAVIYCPADLQYRHFDHLWEFGHRKLNLLESRSAGYVTKYITKTGARPRASQDFGKHTTKHFNPHSMDNQLKERE